MINCRRFGDQAGKLSDQAELAADSLTNLGILNLRLYRLETAQENLQKALQMIETSLGKDHLRSAGCLLNLGEVFVELADYAQENG